MTSTPTNPGPVRFGASATGVGTMLDVEADLAWKKSFDVNSWFAIGHFQSGRETIDYLFHLIILNFPPGPVIQAAASITNETTGWYQGTDVVLPVTQARISGDAFDIEVPNGTMQGDFASMRLTARTPAGQVDVRMSAESPVIFNGGTGVFPLLGMQVHQYSLPRLRTKGTIIIDGIEHRVEGVTWFDRQWQNQDFSRPEVIHWTWMDINLDNGDAISLWSAPDLALGTERAWATILHPDGSQTVTAVEPTPVGASDYWTSEDSGNTYPTRWTVRIPQFAAVLDVLPTPRRQEIISQVAELNKYEAASVIAGTYKGRDVTGFGYVELVGAWK